MTCVYTYIYIYIYIFSCSLSGVCLESRIQRLHLGTLRVPKWSPTSACRSGDQSVDLSLGNISPPGPGGPIPAVSGRIWGVSGTSGRQI